MNYAALLGIVAAAAFMLPLLARLAELQGLHRNLGVAVSLMIAVVTAGIWYVRSVRSRAAAKRRGPEQQSTIAQMGTVAPVAAINSDTEMDVAGSTAEEPDEGV